MTAALSPLWTPSDELVANANVTRFMARLGVRSYAELNASIAADVRPFNAAIVEELALDWDRPYDQLLDLSRGKPFARWFAGGELNAAANCLDRWVARGRGADSALVYEGEDGVTKLYSFAELRDEVARLGAALRQLGVR